MYLLKAYNNYIQFIIASIIIIITNCHSINENENYFEFKVSSIHNLIQNHNWTCVDVITYFLHRAHKYNRDLNVIISYNQKALTEAFYLDEYYDKNHKLASALHCIPVLIKDNIDVKGIPTTGGINALRYSIPNKDAVVVENLREFGAIILAKTNLVEMAFSFYNSETGGSCKNPWDKTRTCSRSSSGSGAAIAAGLGIIAIGTETDGSIMGPSAFTGCFGLRPLLSQINMDGIIPLLDSSDTVGPLANHLDDLVLAHSVMANDTSIYINYHNLAINNSSKQFKIAYIDKFLEPFNFSARLNNLKYVLDPEVHAAFLESIDNFKKIGIDVIQINISTSFFNGIIIPMIEEMHLSRYYNCGIPCYKMSLNRYFMDIERFNVDAPYHSFDELRNSKLLGSFFSNFLNYSNVDDPIGDCNQSCQLYIKQSKIFQLITDDWFILENNDTIDALIFPTMATLPEKLDDPEGNTVISATFIAAFSGYSNLNIPIKFSNPIKLAPHGLPIGAMLIASNEGFLNMLVIAKKYEDAYLIIKKLPESTPLIIKKQFENTPLIMKRYCSNSNHKINIKKIFLFFSNIFVLNCIKSFLTT